MDSGSTWVYPMQHRNEGCMISARQCALDRMKLCGIVPKHQVLDNEESTASKAAILASGMTYELVPPNDHRRNLAEKEIQTCKDHFIRVLSGMDNIFPLHLWCQIIPQSERQLLLLRQSYANPNISLYAYLYGVHDYNAKPFVPIGMETLIHEKPSKRKTFSENFVEAYCLSTSPKNYRCWNLWVKDNRPQRISGQCFHK